MSSCCVTLSFRCIAPGVADIRGVATCRADVCGVAPGWANVRRVASGGSDVCGIASRSADVRGVASGGADVGGVAPGSADVRGIASGGADVRGVASGGADVRGVASGRLRGTVSAKLDRVALERIVELLVPLLSVAPETEIRIVVQVLAEDA